MATLKEFEDALREQGNTAALEILAKLRDRDKQQRTVRPARRITGKKMTPELAREILQLNQTTQMTQQEIAFQLGVNQGRVNEVIKRGKWLDGDPEAPEAQARDRAVERAKEGKGITPAPSPRPRKGASRKVSAAKPESPPTEALSPEESAPEAFPAEPTTTEAPPPENVAPEAAAPAVPSEMVPPEAEPMETAPPETASPKGKAAKPAKSRKQGPEQFRLL